MVRPHLMDKVMRRRKSGLGILLMAVVWLAGIAGVQFARAQASTSAVPAGSAAKPSSDLQLAQGLDHFFNLDYDRAIQIFEKDLDRHPQDPAAVNRVLTAVLYRELYRMGLLNPGDYANDNLLSSPHRPADSKVVERIRALANRAEQLEEARLKADQNDVHALYERGVTRALFASYTGLVERAWISALRSAVGARKDHERVLELDPRYTEAKLVVGVHNYVLGSLPMPIKVAASMVGLSGNKEKGLEYLDEVAKSSAENRTDALIARTLFLGREKRYAESLEGTRPLIAEYPQNVIFAIEEGRLLHSLQRDAEAEAVYRKVWQAGRAGKYGNTHYEFAALYLGDLLRARKDYAGAAAAYESVNEVAHADPEVLQKANLGAGEMYDRERKREQAVQRYNAVIAVDRSTDVAELARRHIKEPYGSD